MAHVASFDIRNADDFLSEMIIPQYEDFLQNNGSARHALLSVILVYHVYEWVHQTKFDKVHFAQAYPAESRIALLFELAKGITNGTKHFIPRAKTRVQTGFSSAFSDGFARPLIIENPDGTETSADQFLRTLVDFWKRHI